MRGSRVMTAALGAAGVALPLFFLAYRGYLGRGIATSGAGPRPIESTKTAAPAAAAKPPSGVPGSRRAPPVQPAMESTQPAARSFRVLRSFAHDRASFTQGLAFHNGWLLEGTGLYGGRSKLRRLDPATGHVEHEVAMEGRYFGEGIVVWGDSIIQLTWRERAGFVYDLETFALRRTFPYKTFTGEGWGITHDGRHLIVSDGSPLLFFWDPETLEEVRRVTVHDAGGAAVPRVNELEYVDGVVLANLWYDDRIIRVDPATGEVLEWIDFSSLYPKAQRDRIADCFNGIAFRPDTGTYFVTGKKWPLVYEVALE